MDKKNALRTKYEGVELMTTGERHSNVERSDEGRHTKDSRKTMDRYGNREEWTKTLSSDNTSSWNAKDDMYSQILF
jgi:hypothetical protein